MACCHCQGVESFFSDKFARRELRRYRKNGAGKTTRMLVDALRSRDVDRLSLLDIGGGIGVIQLELLGAGATRATSVEASSGFLAAAREEAERQGVADRVRFERGDFVELAERIDPADIVTLDRVICCYPDVTALVRLSAERARRLYGVVYPRERWIARWLIRPVINTIMAIKRNPFRFFVHSNATVDAILRSREFEPVFRRETLIWQIVLYAR